ncbi:hypothetical protein FRC00_006288 [Tulasnella sp. 408]|nr:hypothetical protein FRC00_006288 [Tulasnella sp. 408]
MLSYLTILPAIVLALIADFHVSANISHPPSFLSDVPITQDQAQHVLRHKPKTTLAQCPIETTQCDYETLEGVIKPLHTSLHSLVRTPFFKYLKIDLIRECPFWESNGFCVLRDCAVTTVDEQDIPPKWRAECLGRLNRPPQEELRKSFPGCYYRDSDFCVLDDEESKGGEYVDLTMNPERFTGYAGPAANSVWTAIYQENCFGLSEADVRSTMEEGDIDQDLLTTSSQGISPAGLSPLVLSPLAKQAHDAEKDLCLEKKVYYRIISGLHASISTQLCLHNLDQRSGEWRPSLQCFVDRVASHPERLQYMYFNTVLLLRAISRAERYLAAYDLNTGGGQDENALTTSLVREVIDRAKVVGQFDETQLFQGEAKVNGLENRGCDVADKNSDQTLKEEFKAHFRNVTRIMDCVGCDKCRLWGKIQTSGVGTALKILFELDEAALDPVANPNLLLRSEVVTLFNTLHQFSESLMAVDEFRLIWAQNESSEAPSLRPPEGEGAHDYTNSDDPRSQEQPLSTAANLSGFATSCISGVVNTCKKGVACCLEAGSHATRKVVDGFSALFKHTPTPKSARSDL